MTTSCSVGCRSKCLLCAKVADTITELKLGNGTSVLIFANIASALPTSVGGAITQASGALRNVFGLRPAARFLCEEICNLGSIMPSNPV